MVKITHLRRIMEDRLPKPIENLIVLLTGARQVGKTTSLLKKYPELNYLNLDDVQLREELASVKGFEWGKVVGESVLDEIQKKPELLEKVKIAFDNKDLKFSVLSGSSQILLQKKIKETLAGRIFIYELWPLLFCELNKNLNNPLLKKILVTKKIENVLSEENSTLVGNPKEKLLQIEKDLLHWGGMPGLANHTDERKKDWLRSYTSTYLERDLSDLARLNDLSPFKKLQQLLALRAAQLLSYSELARDTGISVETSRKFVEYLRISYQCFLLQPFSTNLSSQVIKSPKVYWVDMGILRYLSQKWNVTEGDYYENYVVAEVVKYIRTTNIEARPYFYRTRSGREIDMLIETPNGYITIEIKYRNHVVRSDFTSMVKAMEKNQDKWVGGMVIYTGNEIKSFSPNLWAVPSWRLLG